MEAQDFASKVNLLSKCIEDNSARIQEAGLENMIGDLKNRIFLDGKATDGSQISAKVKAKNPRVGDYSKSQGRKRAKRNRRNEKVNLFMEGDLSEDIQIGNNNGEKVLGFLNDDQREIGASHETYRKQLIFGASSFEIELLIEGSIEEINVTIEDCVT